MRQQHSKSFILLVLYRYDMINCCQAGITYRNVFPWCCLCSGVVANDMQLAKSEEPRSPPITLGGRYHLPQRRCSPVVSVLQYQEYHPSTRFTSRARTAISTSVHMLTSRGSVVSHSGEDSGATAPEPEQQAGDRRMIIPYI
jgi:hypothetical protein